MKAKYIIIEIAPLLEVPLLCPHDSGVTHADLAAGKPVVAAGFCRIDGDQVLAHGESVGLQIKSRGTPDAELITKHFCGGKA